MAFAKRTYKKTASKPAYQKPAQASAPAADRQQRRPYGGSRGGYQSKGQSGYPKKQQGQDSDFIRITGMFPAKSGSGSFQVFLKPEHIEILQGLQEGDSLGFSPPQDDKEYGRLWARKAA